MINCRQGHNVMLKGQDESESAGSILSVVESSVSFRSADDALTLAGTLAIPSPQGETLGDSGDGPHEPRLSAMHNWNAGRIRIH